MFKIASWVRGLAGAVISLGLAAAASASPIVATYVPIGNTTGAGPWTLTSTDTTFSGLRFVFSSPIKFEDLTSLSVSYTSVLGGIAGGAPRFAIVVDTDNDNVADSAFLLHWGPAGSFVDPSLGPGNTGNLLALTDVGRYDLGGIGGSPYTDRTAALTAAGNYFVHRATLLIDSFGGHDREFVIHGISGEMADPVPEPRSLLVLAIALLSLAAFGVTRRQARA